MTCFFVAQVLDSARVWYHAALRVQVVSGISALYMCLKLRSNQQEADREPSRELITHASQFLLKNVDEREVPLKRGNRQGNAIADFLELLSAHIHRGNVDRSLLYTNRCFH